MKTTKGDRTLEEKAVNSQRLALGIIILWLIGLCLIPTTSIGCSGSDESGDDLDEAMLDDVPFYARSVNNDSETPIEWGPVSENVLEQIREDYEPLGFVINDLVKSVAGTPAMRCNLAPRNDLTMFKQLLDGLYFLHHTFPEKNLYIVQIPGNDGAGEVEADWDTIVALHEEGYSFETSDGDAWFFWRRLIESDYIADGSDESFGVTVQSGN